MLHRVWADLYGHLHGIVITAHPQNLSFIDFTKCTVAESPEKQSEKYNNSSENLCTINMGISTDKLTFWHCVQVSCTWEALCSCVVLPSVHWVRRPFLQSSSWGCSLSWWWRSGSCSACTLDSADAPSLRAGRSSCGTTLKTKTRQGRACFTSKSKRGFS